jgi:hypothetical protein
MNGFGLQMKYLSNVSQISDVHHLDLGDPSPILRMDKIKWGIGWKKAGVAVTKALS